MVKNVTIACFCFFYLHVTGQGIPDIINFTNEDYQAGNQNWKIRQDRDGLIYVANNDGLLCYSGKEWHMYKLPGNTQLRSIEMGEDGVIYAGGVNEVGYFSNKTGHKLSYTSLTKHLPDKEKAFGDIWSIAFYKNSVYFRSANTIFKWHLGKFTFFHKGDWRYLGIVDSSLYAQNGDKGIMKYSETGLVRQGINISLPQGARISNIFSMGAGRHLIITQNHGFYILKDSKTVPFSSNITNEISNSIISVAIKVGSKIAIGTRAQGLYVLDENLELAEHLTRLNGLHNNHIISLFSDNQSNLWIGFDNGIGILALSSSIRKLSPDPQDIGAGYAVAIHNQKLYLGTANGLYFAPYSNEKYKIVIKENFRKVNGTKGQVWKLAIVKSKLWMAHHNGAFIIEGENSRLVEAGAGYWDFVAKSSDDFSNTVYGLSYKGLNALHNSEKTTDFSKVDIAGGRYMLMHNNFILILQQGKRVVKVDKNNFENGYKIIDFSTGMDSIDIYQLASVNQKPMVCTNQGVFEYDADSEEFIPSETFTNIFGINHPRYLWQDANGLIWFIQSKKIGFINNFNSKPNIKFIPELFNRMIPDYQQIDMLSDGLAILGSSSGFYLLDLVAYKNEKNISSPKILKVKLLGSKDSTLFEGNMNYTRTNTIAPLQPGWKSIEFQFIAPFFKDQKNVEYSYMLEGMDKLWSPWNQRSAKEYNNLSPGTYTFKVRSGYNGKISTHETAVTFEVLPTWYQSRSYKVGLVLLGILVIWQILRIQQKKAEKRLQQAKEEQEKLRVLQQLEIDRNEKEIINLKNEKLEAEISFKNAELASTAMHLVQKGEFIDKLKIELSNLAKLPPSIETKNGLNRLIKSLGDNERIDSEWEIFAKHFDQIHKDFLLNVKTKFPQLSPNEVKLCAFIKIDLSTKEIAQLLNISVRGVEISRYRLRRKMDIPNRLTFHTFLSEHGL